MNTFYLDTEFNGHGGQLISLALVSPMGPTLYVVKTLPDPLDPWVAQHVVPVLDFEEPLSYPTFRIVVQEFIRQYQNPTIICDWHADAVHFLKLLEGPDFGSSLDFACQIHLLKTPPGEPVSKVPHNALADARALMDWHIRTTNSYNEGLS
jgi:hypothetical protein